MVLAKVDRNSEDGEKGKGNKLMNIMSRGVKIEADVLFDLEVANDLNFNAIVLPGGLGGA